MKHTNGEKKVKSIEHFMIRVHHSMNLMELGQNVNFYKKLEIISPEF